jgi:hypothetical protein
LAIAGTADEEVLAMRPRTSQIELNSLARGEEFWKCLARIDMVAQLLRSLMSDGVPTDLFRYRQERWVQVIVELSVHFGGCSQLVQVMQR